MSHTAIKRLPYTVDLNESTRKVYLDGVFVTDDNEGHQFDLYLYRGSAPVQLPSGVAVHGYFTRYSDNTTLTLKKGTVSGNVASIKLDKACYALPGQFALVIKVMEGEAISALFYAEGSMVVGNTGKVIDAGNVIPSLDELLAKIADMEAATADGRAAAQEARDAGAQSVGIAQDAAGEALAAAQTVQSIYDFKADAIMDESARAASHVVYPQDGPLAVTLYGKTTENGTGDKSPENPYMISGVDAAMMYAGGKNLAKIIEETNGKEVSGVKFTVDNQGRIHCTGTASAMIALYVSKIMLPPCSFTYSGAPSGASATTYSINALVNGAYIADETGNGFSTTCKLPINEVRLIVVIRNGVTVNDLIFSPQIELGTVKTAYEPYNANVITPPLLPDGAPLMGNGTVDDTIENDVLSGCDKSVTIDGSIALNDLGNGVYWIGATNLGIEKGSYNHDYPPMSARYAGSSSTGSNSGAVSYLKVGCICWRNGGGGTNDDRLFINTGKAIEETKAEFTANPLTVYYRSTDYTPDKNLRVCKVVRKYKTVTFDGSTDEVFGLNGICYVLNSAYVTTPVASAATLGNAISDYLPIRSAEDVYAGIDGISVRKDGKMQIYISGVASVGDLLTYLAAKPLTVTYRLATPETYMTDPIPLRKPTGIMPVTVTGSAETAVTYPHETKHYIDSKISELVTLALANQ